MPYVGPSSKAPARNGTALTRRAPITPRPAVVVPDQPVRVVPVASNGRKKLLIFGGLGLAGLLGYFAFRKRATIKQDVVNAEHAIETGVRQTVQTVEAGAQQAAQTIESGVRKVVSVFEQLYSAAGRAAFHAVLPSEAQPYADVILAVAQQKSVSPFVIYALGSRETGWGTAKAYHGDTGDHGSRWISDKGLAGAYKFAKGAGLLTGQTKTSKKGTKTSEVRAPSINGSDPGWGYGLMQVDAASFWDWLHNNDWRDPATNIAKGVDIFLAKMKYIHSKLPNLAGRDLLRATLAAYNTGEGNVVKSIQAGKDPDATTTGGNYSADSLNRALQLIAAYQTQAPDGGTADQELLPTDDQTAGVQYASNEQYPAGAYDDPGIITEDDFPT